GAVNTTAGVVLSTRTCNVLLALLAAASSAPTENSYVPSASPVTLSGAEEDPPDSNWAAPGIDTVIGDVTTFLSLTFHPSVVSFARKIVSVAGTLTNSWPSTKSSIDGGDLSTSKDETAEEEWPTASDESIRRLCVPSERFAASRSISKTVLEELKSIAAAPIRAGSPLSIVYVQPAGFFSSISTGILMGPEPMNFGTLNFIRGEIVSGNIVENLVSICTGS